MKLLWLCEADALEQDPFTLKVAETEEEAIKKFKQELDKDGITYYTVTARAIEEVDGHSIKVVNILYNS